MDVVLQLLLDIFLKALVGNIVSNLGTNETVAGWFDWLAAAFFGLFGL